MTRANEARKSCEGSIMDAAPSSFEMTKRRTSSHRTDSTDPSSSSDGSFDGKQRNKQRSTGAAKQDTSRSEMLKILTEADPEMTWSQRFSIVTPVKKKKVLVDGSVSATTMMNPMDDGGNLSNDSFGFGHEDDGDWWDSSEVKSTTQEEFQEVKPTRVSEKTSAPSKSANKELSRSRHSEHKESLNKKQKDQNKNKKKHCTSVKVRASDANRTNVSPSSIDPKVIEAMKASGGGRRRISAKELEEMGVKVPVPRGRPSGLSASEHQPTQMKRRARSKSRGRLFVRSQSRGRAQGGDSTAGNNKSVRSKSLGRPSGGGDSSSGGGGSGGGGGKNQQQRSRSRGRVRETSDSKSRSHSVGRSRARSRARSTTRASHAEDRPSCELEIPMTISIEIKPTNNKVVEPSPVTPDMRESLPREDPVVKRASDQRERCLPTVKNLLPTKSSEDKDGDENAKLIVPASPEKLSFKKNKDNTPTAPKRYTSPLKRLKRVFSGRFSPIRSPKKVDDPGTPKTEPSVPSQIYVDSEEISTPTIKDASTSRANKKEGDMYSLIKSAGITESQMRALAEKGLTIAEG